MNIVFILPRQIRPLAAICLDGLIPSGRSWRGSVHYRHFQYVLSHILLYLNVPLRPQSRDVQACGEENRRQTQNSGSREKPLSDYEAAWAWRLPVLEVARLHAQPDQQLDLANSKCRPASASYYPLIYRGVMIINLSDM